MSTPQQHPYPNPVPPFPFPDPPKEPNFPEPDPDPEKEHLVSPSSRRLPLNQSAVLHIGGRAGEKGFTRK